MTLPADILRPLETPRVVVDHARLSANIRRVADLARAAGVAVRPHIKTHKCREIARLQLAAGATGLTASKTDEALVFIEDGAPSLTVAYPVLDPRKLDRLLKTAREKGCDLRMLADSEQGATALAAAAERHGHDLPVFLKIDVGLHRCGLAPDDPRLLPLAQRIAGARHLRLAGILSHAGHAYGAKDAARVREIARDENRLMNAAAARVREAGLDVPEISVGSTPTVLAGDAWEGVTEIRPGNYVFMDRTPLRLGLAGLADMSLWVLATVVSANQDWLIVDAGSKVLSSDGGGHGSALDGHGLAFPLDAPEELPNALTVRKLSEEHGFVERGDSKLGVGDVLRILPNHTCPVANLCECLLVLEVGNAILNWEVSGRAKVK
jgi:D-serine deaminase-like pyridoxal phosphate-dependent protein